MNLRFSVITPSFRQGRFIKRTIQSVLTQGIPSTEYEYVICDGGSDDETIEILKHYEKQIRWVSEPDDGQADAVNKAISMTTGDIIAWINSDDVYYPGAFKAVKALFEANPEIQVIYGDADHIDEHDKIIESYPTESWNYERLIQICYLCQPAVFFRRSLVEKLGNLDASLKYCMDYELWLRYGKSIPFHYLPQKLAGSRLYQSNKTLGQRVAVHYEINEMLCSQLGTSTEKWILSYVNLKIKQELKLDRNNTIQHIIYYNIFVYNSMWAFWKWKKLMPLEVLKILLYIKINKKNK